MWLARRLFSPVALKGRSGLLCRPPVSLPDSEPRYLHCTCCWRARIVAPGFELLDTALSTDACKDDDKPLDFYYTPEQRTVILQRLNSATESEFAGIKLLRGRKLVSLIEYRTRNGPFKDLESVVNVPLLKHKSAVIVFNSILHPEERKEAKKTKVQLAKFIRPEVDRSLLEDANSIVSIVCGTNKIAWAHMDRALTVLDWRQMECSNFMKGTYMASSYLDNVSAVVSELPTADFFVVEKPALSMENTTLYPIMAHLCSVEAMLFALLQPPQREHGVPPKVLNMMRSAVGRHFGLMVGKARTSGAHIVRQMMTESVTELSPRVKFPAHLLLKYRNSIQAGSKNREEDLCNAMLQAVTFFELLWD